MTHPPAKVIFTGDFLRPMPEDLRPAQHENIYWLARLLQEPVRMATGLPCEILRWHHSWIEGARLETSTIEAIYGAFWRQPDIHAWAEIFAAETLPAAVEDLFADLFRDSLVIGFELPPYLVQFCTRHDIAFIDCALSPIRFMDDLVFQISTSTPDMTAALAPYQVPEDLIRLSAGVVAGHAARMFPDPPQPNGLLVILQTPFDKGVIHNGRFVSLSERLDTLCEIADGYRDVLIRTHPLDPEALARDTVQAALPQARLTGENVYRLMAHHNLAGVAALSSSCLIEATYFGKTSHALMPAPSAEQAGAPRAAVNVDERLLCPDFWRDLLGAAGCEVSPHDGLRLPAKPNRFRQHLRTAWGYNQIDTDIFVQWAGG